MIAAHIAALLLGLLATEGEAQSAGALVQSRISEDFSWLRQSVPLIVDGQAMGTLSFDPSRAKIIVMSRKSEIFKSKSILLHRLIGEFFQPLAVHVVSIEELLVVGIDVETKQTLVYLITPFALKRSQCRPLIKTDAIRYPIAIASIPVARIDGPRELKDAPFLSRQRVVLLADDSVGFLTQEGSSAARYELFSSLPDLVGMRYLQASPVPAMGGVDQSTGIQMRLCSVSPEAEGIPMISNPQYIELSDLNGDGVIDRTFPPR